MIGERGMWFKKTLFDPAIQVPLIIAKPGQTPGRVSSLTSLVDVFPTLLELAEIPNEAITTQLDGTSLVSVMDGEEHNRPVFVEQLDGGTAAPRVCVRLGDWKLIVSRAYPPMLFDIATDPLELNNCARKGLPVEAELTKLAGEKWSLDQLHDDIITSQIERKLVDAALATGRPEVWDFTPYSRDGNPGYVRRGDSFPEVEQRGYLKTPSKT